MNAKRLQGFHWRLAGPHRGGRVVAVAGHPHEKGTFYFGGCAGGVWKSTSGGALWENISDGYFATSAVGAMAVSNADPNVIYVGTGETAIRSNISHGDGVYRSTDGGRTWSNVGLKDTRYIGDIEIHPQNPDHVYVAALGHAWGPNEDRGVYRSLDGGASWQKILYTSERAGCHDIALDPQNPRMIFAAMWQAQRYPYSLSSGGEESGIWRSRDGGDTWEDITRNRGLTKDQIIGKIGLAVSPAKPGRVWALIESEHGGLFRSDDYGDTWQLLTENMDLRRRPWYYMHIFADPSDGDTVYVLNLNMWKSTDGGKSFEQIPTPHGDNHGLWIDPQEPTRMIEGNDGGACVSFDGGQNWSSILNQPTAQFYHVMADNQFPYYLYGSQQDNWAMRMPSISFEGAISWKDYVEPGGGESGYIAVSPKPPYRVFAGGIGTGLGHGRMVAWDPESGHKRNVTVWPETHGFGAGAESLKYRFQWTFPIEFSPHDPNVLYATSNYVHKSTDEGDSWEVISPDLTTNTAAFLGSSGGPITADNSGAEIYCTIFAFRESPLEAGLLWAGSDDGLVHVSRDGGKNWANVTPPDLPELALISIIEPSPHDAGTAYVTATRYKHDDFSPYIYKTVDYGATWTSVIGDLPSDEITRVVREDPNRKGLLYCGTETGLYLSFDDGATWYPFRNNLPVVPIYDVIIKDNDLIAATHGRAFWILDDLSPLYQMTADTDGDAVQLFAPRTTTRFRMYGRAFGRTPGITNYKMTGPVTVAYHPDETASGAPHESFIDAGQNPPEGAIISYFLKEQHDGDITIHIRDANGNPVREYSSTATSGARPRTEAGLHRLVWDLRGEKPTSLERKGSGNAREEMMEAGLAPRVLPGVYQVTLTAGDIEQSAQFTVVQDPRVRASEDDLRQQFELKSSIRDELSTVNGALNQLRRIRAQLEAWEERAASDDAAKSVAETAGALKGVLSEIESLLINVDSDKAQPGPAKIREKLLTLSVMIDESDDRPTAGARDVFNMLADQVEALGARLRQAVDVDVRAFNAQIQDAKLPVITP